MAEKEYIERESTYNDMLYEMCGTGYQSRALSVINYAPAADVAPVKHGYWEELDEEGCYSCSACGNPWIIIDGTPQDNEMYFCPNCGAKMDGGEQGNAT